VNPALAQNRKGGWMPISFFRKEPAHFMKSTAIYLHRREDRALVATHKWDEYPSEVDGAVSEGKISDRVALGSMIAEGFHSCFFAKRSPEELRKKPTDWPAFKASGEKSVRRFEDNWVCYQISSLIGAPQALQIFSPTLHEVGYLSHGINLPTNRLAKQDFNTGSKVAAFHQYFLAIEQVPVPKEVLSEPRGH
jgi:hypothetical protein